MVRQGHNNVGFIDSSREALWHEEHVHAPSQLNILTVGPGGGIYHHRLRDRQEALRPWRIGRSEVRKPVYFPHMVSLKEENASQSQHLPVVMSRRTARRNALRARAPLLVAVGA